MFRNPPEKLDPFSLVGTCSECFVVSAGLGGPSHVVLLRFKEKVSSLEHCHSWATVTPASS